MALSHVCIQCGIELARIRARFDPQFQLPMVQCPRCSAGSTRRTYINRRANRRKAHAIKAAAFLMVKFVFALLLVFLFLVIASHFMTEMRMGYLKRAALREAIPLVLSFLAAPVAIGTCVYVAFGYIRLPWLAVGWLMAVFLSLSLFSSMICVSDVSSEHSPKTWSQALPRWWEIWTLLQGIVITTLLCSLGLPIGMLIRTAQQRSRTKRIRRLRQKRRQSYVSGGVVRG